MVITRKVSLTKALGKLTMYIFEENMGSSQSCEPQDALPTDLCPRLKPSCPWETFYKCWSMTSWWHRKVLPSGPSLVWNLTMHCHERLAWDTEFGHIHQRAWEQSKQVSRPLTACPVGHEGPGPQGEEPRTQILTSACLLVPAWGILFCKQVATGSVDLTSSQTWSVVLPVITKDVIRTHNELAEKYLPEPGT